MNYKAQELPEFISSMKEVIISQKKEIEKAAAYMGEYRLTNEYENLATDTRKFFQMSEKQHEKHTQALFSTALVEYTTPNEPDNSVTISKITHSENILHQLSIPAYLADKIWNEFAKILSNDSAVCPSPGCSDNSQWLVQSTVINENPFFCGVS